MLRLVAVLLASAILAMPAVAHTEKSGGLEIVHPWTPETKKDTASARVFMTIRNRSGKPDRLLSASTPRAGKVELKDAGKGAAAFVVKTGKELDLYGDGPGVILTGLDKALYAYDDFRMTLVFEHAGQVGITVMVEEAQ